MDTCMRYLKLFAYESKEKKLIAQKISIKTIILRLNWIYLSLIERHNLSKEYCMKKIWNSLLEERLSHKNWAVSSFIVSLVSGQVLYPGAGAAEKLNLKPLKVTKLA